MANNRHSDGLAITFLLGAGETAVKVNDGYAYGTMVGIVTALKRGGAEWKGGRAVVATEASAENDEATIAMVGVWKVAKASGQAWARGVAVYFDSTAKNFTTTSSGNVLAGKTEYAAQSGDTVGVVRLQNQ